MTTDAMLLQKFAETNDAEAFKELARRHANLVFGVCLRITGNRQDAEDIAQECFMEMAKKARCIDTCLSGWLHKVSKFKSISWVRSKVARREREKEVSELLADARQDASDDEIPWVEIRKNVDEALDSLPDDLRVPLIMHFLEDDTQEQIAGKLGLSQPTVSRRLESGVTELRERLKNSGVQIPATAMLLAAALAVNMKIAAPATLVAALGKMALAGVDANASLAGSSTATAGNVFWTGSVIMKAGIGVLVATAVTVGVVEAVRSPRSVKKDGGSLLGAADFYPSSEHPFGWRGDGTGRFPGATPPMEWSRTVDGCKAALSRASVPAGNGDLQGTPLVRGAIAEGLMLGPIPAEADIGNPATAAPQEGDVVAGSKWKLMMRGKPKSSIKAPAVALLATKGVEATYMYFTRLFVDRAGKATIEVQDDKKPEVWINGKSAAGAVGDFLKGWNRLLVKTTLKPSSDTVEIRVAAWRNATEYRTKNMAWMCQMTGESGSMPLIVGKRIYVTTDMSDLMCLDKATGKVLWIRSSTSAHIASGEEKASQAYKDNAAGLVEKLDRMNEQLVAAINTCNAQGYASITPSAEKRALNDLIGKQGALERQAHDEMHKIFQAKYKSPESQHCGYANATPVTDGKHVWAYFPGYATLAMYDLDGKMIWGQGLFRNSVEHGNHGSPALVGSTLIVPSGENVIALKADTGEIVWEKDKLGWINYGSVMAFRSSGVDFILLNNSVILRASDGAVMEKRFRFGFPWGTPVTDNGVICATGRDMDTGAWIGRLPEKLSEDRKVSWNRFSDEVNADSCVASPLLYDGIAYVAQMSGLVKAFDVKSEKTLWQEFPDWECWTCWIYGPGACASPTLAGKYIYLFGNDGKNVILEPGPVFKVVAMNTIENIQSVGTYEHVGRFEQLICNPAFEGSRIYLHGPEYLYCVGEK